MLKSGVKRILMIIAFSGYQDHEYETPKEIFLSSGVQVVTASTQIGQASGKLGGHAQVEMILNEVRVEDFDAVVFVGGPGARTYQDNAVAHQIAQRALVAGKALAAICIAPIILAKAGTLRGKGATVWTSPEDTSAVDILKNGGAEYIPQDVVMDGKLVTANGPAAAFDFAEKIISLL